MSTKLLNSPHQHCHMCMCIHCLYDEMPTGTHFVQPRGCNTLRMPGPDFFNCKTHLKLLAWRETVLLPAFTTNQQQLCIAYRAAKRAPAFEGRVRVSKRAVDCCALAKDSVLWQEESQNTMRYEDCDARCCEMCLFLEELQLLLCPHGSVIRQRSDSQVASLPRRPENSSMLAAMHACTNRVPGSTTLEVTDLRTV
jgi:hypothetical protein